MLINNSSNPTLSFKQKYPTETILAVASKKDIRKSDAVNFINSITKLKKDEQKAMLKIDNIVFLKYLETVSDYLVNQVPGLKKFVIQLDSNLYKKEDIYNKAIVMLGDEIDVKRLSYPRVKK